MSERAPRNADKSSDEGQRHSETLSEKKARSSAIKYGETAGMAAQRRMESIVDSSPRMAAQRLTKERFGEVTSEASSSRNLGRDGLPNQLKAGIEGLSGMSMDHVKVHYNSSQPAQLNAHAYAQGHEIHLGPGQEKHLPHEAWHVVQQAQGRVRPTIQMMAGVKVNDDKSLEAEADLMGSRALLHLPLTRAKQTVASGSSVDTKQLMLESPVKAGDRIKICTGDADDVEVREVLFVKKEGQAVFYEEIPEPKKPAKKPEKKSQKSQKPPSINEAYAFDIGIANSEIKIKVAADQVEVTKFKGIKSVVPESVIEFLKGKVNEYNDQRNEDEETDVTIDATSRRMLIAMSELDALKDELENNEEIDDEGHTFWGTFVEDQEGSLDEEMIEELWKSINFASNPEQSSASSSSRSTSTSSKKKGWIHPSIAKQKTTLKAVSDPDDLLSDGTSLHHKLSRNRIKKLIRLAADASPPKMNAALAVIAHQTGITDQRKALENWAPNLELGPIVDKRAPGDDPGAGVDVNVIDGTMTPRSSELAGVDAALAGDGAINWDELAAALHRIVALHGAGNKISPPKLRQWTRTSDGIVRAKEPREGKEESKMPVEDELAEDDD